MQTVVDFIYNQRILIVGLYKLQRGACALSLQVLNTVSIEATFCVQLVFESVFFKQNL